MLSHPQNVLTKQPHTFALYFSFGHCCFCFGDFFRRKFFPFHHDFTTVYKSCMLRPQSATVISSSGVLTPKRTRFYLSRSSGWKPDRGHMTPAPRLSVLQWLIPPAARRSQAWRRCGLLSVIGWNVLCYTAQHPCTASCVN